MKMESQMKGVELLAMAQLVETACIAESIIRHTPLNADDPHVQERAAELVLITNGELTQRKHSRSSRPC
jgi:hypothetical protein